MDLRQRVAQRQTGKNERTLGIRAWTGRCYDSGVDPLQGRVKRRLVQFLGFAHHAVGVEIAPTRGPTLIPPRVIPSLGILIVRGDTPPDHTRATPQYGRAAANPAYSDESGRHRR